MGKISDLMDSIHDEYNSRNVFIQELEVFCKKGNIFYFSGYDIDIYIKNLGLSRFVGSYKNPTNFSLHISKLANTKYLETIGVPPYVPTEIDKDILVDMNGYKHHFPFDELINHGAKQIKDVTDGE